MLTAPCCPSAKVRLQVRRSSFSSRPCALEALRGWFSSEPVKGGTSSFCGCRRRLFLVSKSWRRVPGTPAVMVQCARTQSLFR